MLQNLFNPFQLPVFHTMRLDYQYAKVPFLLLLGKCKVPSVVSTLLDLGNIDNLTIWHEKRTTGMGWKVIQHVMEWSWKSKSGPMGSLPLELISNCPEKLPKDTKSKIL